MEEAEPDTKRRRRAWELWSSADKHVFFAALNLYGKDFDKIQVRGFIHILLRKQWDVSESICSLTPPKRLTLMS